MKEPHVHDWEHIDYRTVQCQYCDEIANVNEIQ